MSDLLNVDQVFDVLKSYRITSNKESVRRWLRQGVIQGIEPQSRKGGWKVTEKALMAFVRGRIPFDRIDMAPTLEESRIKEEARAEMWWQLVRENYWTGFLEVKKSDIKACVEHRQMPDKWVDVVYQSCKDQSRGYAKPRILYILDAFLFEGERVPMDQSFGDTHEQILYAVLERVRKRMVKKD